jgi:predicted  nucleic acid-binding Zn-ribbon protein
MFNHDCEHYSRCEQFFDDIYDCDHPHEDCHCKRYPQFDDHPPHYNHHREITCVPPPILAESPTKAINSLAYQFNELREELNRLKHKSHYKEQFEDPYYDNVTVSEGSVDGKNYKIIKLSADCKSGIPKIELHLPYNNITNSGLTEASREASTFLMADKLFSAGVIEKPALTGYLKYDYSPLPADVDASAYTFGVAESGFIHYWANTTSVLNYMTQFKIKYSSGCVGLIVEENNVTDISKWGEDSTSKARIAIGLGKNKKDIYVLVAGNFDGANMQTGYEMGLSPFESANIMNDLCKWAVTLSIGSSAIGLDKGQYLYKPSAEFDVNNYGYWYISKKKYVRCDKFSLSIGDLYQKLGATLNLLVNLESANIVINNRIDDLREYVDERDTFILGLLDEEVTRLNESIDSLYHDLYDEITRAITAENLIQDNLNAFMSSTNATIANIYNTLSDINSSIDAINADLTSIHGQIAYINSVIANINVELISIHTDINYISGEITTINNTIDGINSDIVTINNTLATMQSTLNDFENRITANRTDIDNLNNNVVPQIIQTLEEQANLIANNTYRLNIEQRYRPVTLWFTDGEYKVVSLIDNNGYEIWSVVGVINNISEERAIIFYPRATMPTTTDYGYLEAYRYPISTNISWNDITVRNVNRNISPSLAPEILVDEGYTADGYISFMKNTYHYKLRFTINNKNLDSVYGSSMTVELVGTDDPNINEVL